MKPLPASELQIRLWLAQKKRVSDYHASIQAHFQQVHLAAQYFLEFADSEPNINYLDESNFEVLVASANENIESLVQEINQEVLLYWRASLLSVRNYNEFLISKYKKEFGSKVKEKHKIHTHGYPKLAVLNSLSARISQTIANLPNSDIQEPKDITQWDALAKICVPLLNDTYETHVKVGFLIKNIRKARKAKKDERLEHLYKTGSGVFQLGQVYMGVPSTSLSFLSSL